MIDLLNSGQISQARSECTSSLTLTFNDLTFRLFANNPEILSYLDDYYAGLTDSATASTELSLFLFDGTADTAQVDWHPVKRAKASALGLKEAYADTAEGRWIHKVRTGMVMFQSLRSPMVVGDLLKNRAQVVNFINNQFLNHQQRQRYLLGHASAFTVNGDTTAIAASSGGGKSTLMLRAMESSGTRFLSNDRILFQPEAEHVRVLGVAKHPRVNPGTLVNSERLISILPEAERAKFEGMPTAQLWEIEQKYDVLISQAYGESRANLSGHLTNLILLDWSLNSSTPTELCPVDISKTPDALDGLRKNPGPFFQLQDGTFPPEHTQPATVYAQHLPGVQVYRLAGQVDFDRAIELLQERGIL